MVIFAIELIFRVLTNPSNLNGNESSRNLSAKAWFQQLLLNQRQIAEEKPPKQRAVCLLTLERMTKP
jgi:hypothetical protein